MQKQNKKRRKQRRGPNPNQVREVVEVPVDVTPLRPLNENQTSYIQACYEDEQTIALGPAGTGKTFISATVASDLLLGGEIDKIVLTRPALGVDEDLGFLPGTLEAKYGPWVIPFTEIMKRRMGKSYYTFLKDGSIEIIPLAYMRGRTFNNALVILDEGQNTTITQIRMFLTRIGEGSRIIINGDLGQTDLPTIEESGLYYILEMQNKYDLPVSIIEFSRDDVVRSGICKVWAEAFEQDDMNQRLMPPTVPAQPTQVWTTWESVPLAGDLAPWSKWK